MDEWRNMFLGFSAFALTFLLFIVGFIYAIFATNEPIAIKVILGFVVAIFTFAFYACLFVYMPDAWSEWHKKHN